MDNHINGNYIEFFYDENENLNAKISTSELTITVIRKQSVNKLIQLAANHGIKVNGPCTFENYATTIKFEYDDYKKILKKKMDRDKRLKILGNLANQPMKLIRERKCGSIVVGTVIFGVLFGGATLANNLHKNSEFGKVNDKSINTNFDDDTQLDSDVIYDDDDIIVYEDNHEVENESFDFYFADRTNEENLNNALRYNDIFEKYSKMYGIDKKILISMAAQESNGDHYNNLNNGPAVGIMQIEKTVFNNKIVSAYNFITNEVDEILVNDDSLQNLDLNIKIGTMILRNNIEDFNYNIPLALQTYNFGPGNMNKVLDACCFDKKINKEQIYNDPTNNVWLDYREFLNCGDPNYIEHVFSYLNSNSEIYVLNRNNDEITVNITNNYNKENNVTKK